MVWNLSYELATMVGLCTIAIYVFTSKRMSNKQNTTYQFLLVLSLLVGLVNIASKHLLNDLPNTPLVIHQALTTGYLVLHSIQYFLVFYYIKLITIHRFSSRVFDVILYAMPLFVAIVAIVASPVTGFAFAIAYETGLVFRSGYLVVLACWLLYWLVSVKHLNRYGSMLSYHQRLAMGISMIGLFVANVLQSFIPGLAVEGIVMTLMLMLCYFVIENPKLNTDELTGLFHRSAFVERLEVDIKRGVPYYIIAMAMDDFKYINETYGYFYGDLLLKAIGKKLKETSKHVFRYGGDTFCIVIYEENDVVQTINRIKSKLEEPWNINSNVCLLSASFCIVSYPENAETSNEMLDFIDFTIHESKKHGKGKITYGKNSTKDKISRNIRIEHLLKEAIQYNRFEVYYQPIYSIKENKYIAAEALVRLYDQELGFISPGEFIPIAEKNGTILKIGLIVFEHVCAFIQANALEGLGLRYIEVNLSVVQCMQRRLAIEMIQLMKKYQINPAQINFEITESAVAESKGMLEQSMQELIAYGCQFSMDDFGTGYSNLSYVIQLPFQVVKIDKGFVWSAISNTKVNLTVAHLISMFQKMGLIIVAEGVETKEQLDMLVDMNCEMIQGFYYSKPLPSHELVKLLHREPVVTI